MTTSARAIFLLGLLWAFSLPVEAEDFTNAIRTFLQRRGEVEKRPGGIVVGLVDEHGSSLICYGKSDNGPSQELNGDTVFEIGSITKTFTALLLQDMVERGEMKLDDPVAKYLPKSVQMPTRNGKQISLLQLATHTSGLPTSSITWLPTRAENPRADYTIEKMYDFVSGYTLTRDPGTKYEYSTVGMALLGQAIALKAGANYESLLIDRICRPLNMDSTRITLMPELKTRFALGHNSFGYAVSSSYWGALMPGAALCSTANDLLKYISANLGLTPSRLTPLMEKTHVRHFHAGQGTDTGRDTDLGLAWMITREHDGERIIQHGGLTDGFIAFTCMELTRRRGVVVLCNSQNFDVPALGRLLLEIEWHSDRAGSSLANILDKLPEAHEQARARVAMKLERKLLDACVGQYEFATNTAFPTGAIMTIWREGDQLVGQASGQNTIHGAFDIFPESQTDFFLKINGVQLTFIKDDAAQVIAVTQHFPQAKFPDCKGKKLKD